MSLLQDPEPAIVAPRSRPMIAKTQNRGSASIPRLLAVQAVVAVVLSVLFGAGLLVSDTQGLGTLASTSAHSGTTVIIVLLGATTSLAPIIIATQIWSLGKTSE